jgi:hypothetical protein
VLDLLWEVRYNGYSFLSMTFAKGLPRCGGSARNLNRAHGVVIGPENEHVIVTTFDIIGVGSELVELGSSPFVVFRSNGLARSLASDKTT